MNRFTTKKITITLTIIGLVISVFSIKPILAHSGHNHNRPDPKTTEIEQEKTKVTEENVQSDPINEDSKTQPLESKQINVTLQKKNQLSLIPQISEIIFLLLVANPIILKVIKRKL